MYDFHNRDTLDHRSLVPDPRVRRRRAAQYRDEGFREVRLDMRELSLSGRGECGGQERDVFCQVGDEGGGDFGVVEVEEVHGGDHEHV